MKAQLRLITCMIILILISSIIPAGIGEESDDLPEWTFMVYLDCDNNLESAGIEDINEMETVGSTDEVNIVVQMDRCAVEGYDSSNGDWTGAKRFYVTQDSDGETINSDEIEDLDEVNMGDPDTLANFTKWAIDNYPAQKYALVLWNHGGAFWGVCWDEDNDDDCLTMPDLKVALKQIEEHLGRDIDLVGFDACLMAQVGVMYQIRNSVDIGVGSGYVEPGDGWPYENILPLLTADPQMDPKELGEIIAKEYVGSYQDSEPDPDDTTAVTQAVLDLEKFDELAYRIDILSMVLSIKAGGLSSGGRNPQIRAARELTNSYDFGSQYTPGNVVPIDPTGYCMYDVIDLMDNLMTDMPLVSDIYDAAQAVKSVAEDVIIFYDVDTWHEGKGAHGLTIYFPSGLDTQYDSDFDTLDFAIDTYWDDFLNYYISVQNAPDTPPAVLIITPCDDDVIDRHENKELKIQGTAFDAQDSISSIEIKINDGDWIPVGASGQWYYDLPLTELENGNHTISARSFDGKDYSAEDSVEIFIIGEKSQDRDAEPLDVVFYILIILVVIGILSYLIILKKRKKS